MTSTWLDAAFLSICDFDYTDSLGKANMFTFMAPGYRSLSNNMILSPISIFTRGSKYSHIVILHESTNVIR